MIEVDGLVVEFPARRVRALDAVTLRISEGERVALVGSSGAGKTTFLRSLVGAAVPTSGSVRVDGREPTGASREAREVRRRTGMIRQGNDLVRGLTSRTNIAMGVTSRWRPLDWMRVARGLCPSGLDEHITELADRYGISDCLDARVEHLSGGQRQRVAVCRALIGGPRLLLADEPTSGLDPVAASAVVDILVAARDNTVIVSTHDLELAARFDRVIALRNGRIVHDGGSIDAGLVTAIYGRDESVR